MRFVDCYLILNFVEHKTTLSAYMGKSSYSISCQSHASRSVFPDLRPRTTLLERLTGERTSTNRNKVFGSDFAHESAVYKTIEK
jgi:hypothetical protein